MGSKSAPLNLNVNTSQARFFDPSLTARMVENMTAKTSPYATASAGANLVPPQDQNMKLIGWITGMNNSGSICVGRIIDGSAHLNCYRVHVERFKGPVMCPALANSSATLIGATSINTYAPGTPVLIYVHASRRHGYILGAFPDTTLKGEQSPSDYISQLTRKRVDDAHKRPYTVADCGDMMNFNAFRPIDATHASEWGALTTTGLKVTLDDFMVQMAVNEFTGIFGFYHDMLLRVAGYNYQHWTSGHEREALNDQGEYNDYQGYTPYPWENFGVLEPGTDLVKEYKPENYLKASGSPYYAHWENKQEFAQPFHRTQEFFGYYGQGHRLIVSGPPKDQKYFTVVPGKSGTPDTPFETEVQIELIEEDKGSPGGPKDRDYDEKPPIGFHEDNIAVDGRRFIASAKGITLAKRVLIPVPTRRRRAEDGSGDDAARNYKAAGLLGAGEEHPITGDIETTNEDFPNMQRAAAVLDLHGYLFNYAGLHPFHWHARDYRTWEQSDLEPLKYNHHVSTFSVLEDSMYISDNDIPKKDVKVDHRYNTQKYFESESYISMLEDGAIVIGDGYGAEIRMCGGVVTISAPGDVWLKPGRNAQVWAGRDCIVRAKGSVDVSTTEKSVRIKAEQNVFILAGNDTSKKEGGVLIESRAKTPVYNFNDTGDNVIFGGVCLRAKNSEVVALARDIYLRTTGGNEGTGGPAGVITIDASRGDGEIVTKSQNMFNYFGQNGKLFHAFRSNFDDDTIVGNLYTRKMSLINGPLYTDKTIIADGPILTRGSFITNKGHVFTQKGGPAAPCQGECAAKVDEAVGIIWDAINVVIPEITDMVDDMIWDKKWYDPDRPGNSDTIKRIEFSWRKQEDYRVDNFQLFEDRWQQLARESGQSMKRWEEVPVFSAGKDTWPFPGKEKFLADDVYKKQSFTIVQNDGGKFKDKDRKSAKSPDENAQLDGAYREPKFKSTDSGSLLDDYMIVG